MAKKKGGKSNEKNKPKSLNTFWKKVIYACIAFVILSVGSTIYLAYRNIYKSNKITKNGEKTYFYIKTGSNFNDVVKSLKQEKIIRSESIFEWLAKQKNYDKKIKPGRYTLKPYMSNNEIINLLRSGEQEPIKLTINNIRTKTELVTKVCSNLEVDSLQLYELLSNDNLLDTIGFNSINITGMFIPDTYDYYWNTSASEFMKLMMKEYQKFWNADRKAKAKMQGISAAEAAIIASIVEKETNYKPERPLVASVYLNRIRKHMKLQADPTVVYANGDFTINRVLEKHLKFDNPYNTYIYEGLPPGPICIPSKNALDAVLDAPKNGFIYFCADDQFNGKHKFAASLSQHNITANKFRKALNKKRIFK
jgi:UPF0755 protein